MRLNQGGSHVLVPERFLRGSPQLHVIFLVSVSQTDTGLSRQIWAVLWIAPVNPAHFEPRPHPFGIGFPWTYVLCREACSCDKEVLVLAVVAQGDAGWMRTANGGSAFSPPGRLIARLSVSGRGRASAPTQDSLLARPQCAGGTESDLHTADTRYTSPLAQDSQALPSPGYAGRLSA